MSEHSWKGRWFEDFIAGDIYKHWPGKTILDADNHWFTLLTLNTNPLHFDETYAAEGQWGKTLVNSTYTLALVTGMSVRDLSQQAVANLGFENVRFTKAVYSGDTIHAESTILDTRVSQSRPDCGIVFVETRGTNQCGEVVLTLQRQFMVKLRGK